MRNNLPVTQGKYAFPADQTLVSVTDIKGRINYCNSSSIEVSGFSCEELLGQPLSMEDAERGESPVFVMSIGRPSRGW